MKIFTIGFTKKSAKTFFAKLRTSGAKRVVDVRLNNVSQLAGFAKKEDLRYFLHEICGMDYVHVAALAPTQEMLQEYKKEKGDWAVYESRFVELMKARRIDQPSVETSSQTDASCAAKKSRRIVIDGSLLSIYRNAGVPLRSCTSCERRDRGFLPCADTGIDR